MGAYIKILGQGLRVARKQHRCFDCYRPIRKGESYHFGTYKYDDVYTLHHHIDCRAASDFYQKFHGLKYNDFDDGIPPLSDMISDGGEREIDHATLRGHFPHVVCRMEYTDQMEEIKMRGKCTNCEVAFIE